MKTIFQLTLNTDSYSQAMRNLVKKIYSLFKNSDEKHAMNIYASADDDHIAESSDYKHLIINPLIKSNWTVNWHDPDLKISGIDVGGGNIYEYDGRPFTGIIREYHSDGLLRNEITCLRGYPDGLQREYFSNGQVAEESYMTHNWDYGPITEWDENGNIMNNRNFGFGLPIVKWILAIDVYYSNNTAKAVGVLFNQFNEDDRQFYVEYISDIVEYIPGEFYKRELPCILKILKRIDLQRVSIIIVDSHVYVDNDKNYGLGGKLWEQLDGNVPVIGVAKTSFARNIETVKEVWRGESNNPLYVSTVGIDIVEAVNIIVTLKGSYRIPDILKLLDQETKST